MNDGTFGMVLATCSSQVLSSEASVDDEVLLHERAQSGDTNAMNTLMLRYTSLVRFILAGVVRGSNVLIYIGY